MTRTLALPARPGPPRRPRAASGPAALSWLLLVLCGLLAGPRAAAGDGARLRLERLRFDALPDLGAYVTYLHGDGTVVRGRPAGDFKLLLDGAEQGAGLKAVPFSATGEPLFLVALVQLSPPVEPILGELRQGLASLAEAAAAIPGSHLDLLGYSGEVHRLCEGEGCRGDRLTGAIRRLAIDPEGTEVRMLDGLQVAIDLLRGQPAGARKLVVLISDGIDVNNERRAFLEVAARAERTGVAIDTLGYAPFEAKKLRSLADLSARSGGVERVMRGPEEVAARFAALAEELRSQYLLTFPLPLAADGKEHTFQVVSDAAGSEAMSQTVTRTLAAGPPPPGQKEAPAREAGGAPSRLWLLAPAGAAAALLLAYLIQRLRRRRVTQAVPPAAPVQLPSMQSPAPPLRTIILPKSGDVVLGWLTGLSGPVKGRDFKLSSRTILGSASDCDVPVADPSVSAHHCEVCQTSEGFKIIDLGSTNGLVVNDRRTKEHYLIDNDVFRIGRVEFKFKAV